MCAFDGFLGWRWAQLSVLPSSSTPTLPYIFLELHSCGGTVLFSNHFPVCIVLLHFIFYMEIQLFQHRWLKRLFSTELSIHLCQKSMDDWKLQINILYTWNLNNIVQRLYLDFKKISGRYMSGSLFGLYVLFCMLCTDPYFYIFTKTTLSWWFIIIVSLEIRQHDFLICSLFPKSDLLFSYFVFIHIFYNKIVSLYPQDPVGVLIWIVSKLGWVLKQSIS